MWKIVHIFDGDYGCEEHTNGSQLMVSVTLRNEKGQERRENVADVWLTEKGLDIGSVWPQ